VRSPPPWHRHHLLRDWPSIGCPVVPASPLVPVMPR
jgi:hypothetical protein